MQVQKISFHKNSLPLKNLSAPENTNNPREDIKNNLYNENTTHSLSEHYLSNQFIEIKPGISYINFKGYRVYILDGGHHASDMYNFAKTVLKPDNTTILKKVDTVSGSESIKDLKNLKESIQTLLKSGEKIANQYIAIPALATVGLLNLQDRLKAVMDVETELTPENIKANKPLLLQLLKKMCNSPDTYKEELGYMDSCNQHMEEIYPVIEGINELINKDARVFIPAGHPFDQSLKYLAKKHNLKPELYYYIATGQDVNGKVHEMKKFIKDNNWYDFNLLTLSNANIITIRDKSWGKDYIFAGYDTCITDSARGVYNLSPVRENGKLTGYSFRNTNVVEYPYEEFPNNDEVANITKFVGKQAKDVLASEKEIRNFAEYLKTGKSKLPVADKLYPVYSVYSKKEIEAEKIRLRGDYVDKTKKLFFRENANQEIIFPQCDCEGSGKPSVKSMWGTCFAVFNAIEKDIFYQEMQTALAKTAKGPNKQLPYLMRLDELMIKARSAKTFEEAENYYTQATELVKSIHKPINTRNEVMPFIELGDLFSQRGLQDKSAGCYNMAIRLISKFITSRDESLQSLKNAENAKKLIDELNDYITKYNNAGFFRKLFMSRPKVRTPIDTTDVNLSILANNLSLTMSELYEEIGNICRNNNEIHSADCCYKAAVEIKNSTPTGDKIITRRADDNDYIGDLVN